MLACSTPVAASTSSDPANWPRSDGACRRSDRCSDCAPRRSGPVPGREDDGPGMKTAGGRGLTIDQGLHTETDPVDAKASMAASAGSSSCPGAHSSVISAPGEMTNSWRRVWASSSTGRGKHAGGASAQVNAVHLLWNGRAAQALPHAADIPANPGDILLVSAHRRNAGGKVAVGAFGAAKRNRNVNTERIHPVPVLSADLADSFGHPHKIKKEAHGRATSKPQQTTMLSARLMTAG